MLFVVLSCLFVFLGMYIGKKRDLKNISINCIFGLFLINSLFNVFDKGYFCLSKNYHDTTMFFSILGVILGILFIKISSFKYENSDDISIFGFTAFNSYLLFLSKFNLLFLIVNILYYVFIGIYIRNSRSWISVLIGMTFGLFLSLFSGWALGYLFTIFAGFLFYFIFSVYGLVFRNNDKKCYYALIIGMIIGLLGYML